ncbi:DUF4190 domain-containing protein [Falsibacillus pallidus]|uniref:DUF4190 domain-containing protein n=1 Tax=Falsibacillus pallidus TaxID=493781 RepID=UPI003D97B563
MGFFSVFIPFIGIILGIFGVVFARKASREMDNNHQSGRGLATAGIVCSGIGIFIQILTIVGYITFAAV